MRFAISFISLLLAGGVASADECGTLNSKLLTIVDWSAKAGDYGSVAVIMKIKSNSEKQIQTVKATARFTDPFGDSVANLAIDPDRTIKAGATYDEKGSWSAARLAKVRKQDVNALLCVSAVLFEDGTKEQFQ